MNRTGKRQFFAALGAAAITGLIGSAASAGGLLDVEFEDADFSGFLATFLIDNPYWPLSPDGQPRTFTYIGETEDECVISQLAYKGNMYTLSTTDTTSPYYMFTALEVEDTEWVFEEFDVCDTGLLPNDAAITEFTLDWYAMDGQKNVWYLGEHSQVFDEEEGCPLYPGLGAGAHCFEGSWEAGLDGPDPEEVIIGEAGIVVPGDEPEDGEPLAPGTYYMQEVAEGAEDMAKILRLDARVSTDFAGDNDNCRKVKEWTAQDPGSSVEHKWYCSGSGLVLIEGTGGGKTEIEELVGIDPALP
jgi:hypothetical protein